MPVRFWRKWLESDWRFVYWKKAIQEKLFRLKKACYEESAIFPSNRTKLFSTISPPWASFILYWLWSQSSLFHSVVYPDNHGQGYTQSNQKSPLWLLERRFSLHVRGLHGHSKAIFVRDILVIVPVVMYSDASGFNICWYIKRSTSCLYLP